MSEDIFESLARLDGVDGKRDVPIIRAPFPYVGGKSRSIPQIVGALPYREKYVEPFCGSAVIMMNRHASKFEVINDLNSGIVAFYRCLRDSTKLDRLCELVDLTVHSREDWQWCKETWERESDDVERAFKWYYMVCYSFSGLGRNFGRSTSTGGMAGKIRNRLLQFNTIHQRLRTVQIENINWEACIMDYDHENTVFYLDPPYIDADPSCYTNKFRREDHERLIEVVFQSKGFVAVSGYANNLYDSQPWDEVIEWDSFVSVDSMSSIGTKSKFAGSVERGHAKEKLWIKN